MSFRSMVLTSAAALAMTANAAAAAPTCVKGQDEAALQTRVIQTELMVAALSCGASANYNAFVKKHQPGLMSAHQRVSGYFKKSYGGASEKELNAFITRLANDSSMRSLDDVPAFCASAQKLYEGAIALETAELPSFVALQPVAQLHGFTPCTPTANAAASGETAATAPAKAEKAAKPQ